jgi:tetratricopeptide (TPR) repeat protein
MSGRIARWIAVLPLALALGYLGFRTAQQREAAQVRRQVEAVSLAQEAQGKRVPTWVAQSLRDLRRAAELDPLDPGIPMLLGGQYMLLDRPREAIEAYEAALALEPRPEFYLNLAGALRQAGEDKAAKKASRQAVVLDWRLRKHVSR